MNIEINDAGFEELKKYSQMSESSLAHIYEPDYGLFIAESPNVIERALRAGYVPESILVNREEINEDTKRILDMCQNVPIYLAPKDILISITGFQMHRGLLCAMKRKPLPDPQILCRDMKRIAVLEGVVNPTNIGAIIRSAAALNIEAVLLSPDCADPLYRRAARVSMGTVFQVPWTYVCKSRSEWDKDGMDIIRKMGFTTVAMALLEDSIPINDSRIKSHEKLAIVLGTEGDGLALNTIEKSDYTAIIPMANGVDSLNVAAASAVMFWEISH